MKTTTHAPAKGVSAWWRMGVAGLLAAHLLLALYVLWRTAVLTPYGDEIDWILRWRDLQVTGDWRTFLLAPVNLHRLPWLFGLLAWDLKSFGGTNLPLVVSGALAVGLLAWLLGREAGRAASPPLALPAATLAAMLGSLAAIVFDAAAPICVNYTHGAALAALAMVLAEGDEARGLSARRVGAVLVSMAAGLGDAVALAVWPVLAIAALRRRDWRWLGAILIVGGAFIGLYAAGQGAATDGSTHSALADPLGALRLSLNFLTLPWTRLSLAYAWIAGLAIALVGAAAVAIHGGPSATRAERVACAFILFSLGAAAMAGLGRYGVADALNVPIRYAVLLAPLHVGLVILALPWLERVWRQDRALAQGLIVAVLLATAGQNAIMSLKLVRASDTIRNVLADFQAGRRTPEMQTMVHPDLARAAALFAELTRNGQFQHELHLKPQAPPR